MSWLISYTGSQIDCQTCSVSGSVLSYPEPECLLDLSQQLTDLQRALAQALSGLELLLRSGKQASRQRWPCIVRPDVRPHDQTGPLGPKTRPTFALPPEPARGQRWLVPGVQRSHSSNHILTNVMTVSSDIWSPSGSICLTQAGESEGYEVFPFRSPAPPLFGGSQPEMLVAVFFSLLFFLFSRVARICCR